MYKSPQSTVADALEIKYVYAPDYTIDETDDKNTALDTYLSLDGLFKVVDSASNNYSTAPESLSDGKHIVLTKAGRWNGLHKVKDAGVGYVTLYTKFSGSASVEVAFEESPELYYNVSALVDESSDVPIPDYLSKAVVYYVKAKMAEDKADYKSKEYFMKQFKQMVEKECSCRLKHYRDTLCFPLHTRMTKIIFSFHNQPMIIDPSAYTYPANGLKCIELVQDRPPITIGMNFLRSLKISFSPHQIEWENLSK